MKRPYETEEQYDNRTATFEEPAGKGESGLFHSKSLTQQQKLDAQEAAIRVSPMGENEAARLRELEVLCRAGLSTTTNRQLHLMLAAVTVARGMDKQAHEEERRRRQAANITIFTG